MENLLGNLVEGLFEGRFIQLSDKNITPFNLKNVFIGQDIKDELIVVFNFPFNDDQHTIYIKDFDSEDFLCISDKTFYLFIVCYIIQTGMRVKLISYSLTTPNEFLVEMYLDDYKFDLPTFPKNSPEYALLVSAWHFMHTYYHYKFSKTKAAKKARSFKRFIYDYNSFTKWQNFLQPIEDHF